MKKIKDLKSEIVLLVLLAAVIGGASSYSIYLESISRELTKKSEAIAVCLSKNDTKSAYRMTTELEDYLERKKIPLASTIEHSYVDEIDKNIKMLSVYTREGQTSDAKAHLEVLYMLFQKVRK